MGFQPVRTAWKTVPRGCRFMHDSLEIARYDSAIVPAG